MALIRFEQASLTRSHADSPNLQALNFEVKAGEILAVMGGCGSGKTTLACWMAGWVPHSMSAAVSGVAQFDGMPLSGGHLARWASQVQLVQARPYAGLTGCAFNVHDEVAFGPENLGWKESDIREQVCAALDLCELTGLALRRPATLSGGEAQRAAIAAAVVMRPRLLLLDEAFSRLAPAAACRMLDRLVDLTRQGTTLVLFEKQFDLAARVAHRVLLLDRGRQQALGSPESVFDEVTDLVRAPDALLAARQARRAGLWREAVAPPLSTDTAPQRFIEVLNG
ncbi:energy-coupling factor ABC transporter ATP-binding protein [Hydrogenophaga bisanensis]|uniref:Energy-coupling factor ABC transporter ATP-binding protein n=1 Tax=Hydrogenophaga bisanensis TaxID=439611 RepID=A0ABW2R4R9_9BURK